jgi:hypothetical protein
MHTTYLTKLTTWRSVVVVEVTFAQPVKKTFEFCGAWNFITLFTTTGNWSLIWTKLIQSTYVYFCKIHFNINLPSMLISSKHVLLQQLCMYFFYFLRMLHTRSFRPHWLYHCDNVGWKAKIMDLLIIWFIQPSSYNSFGIAIGWTAGFRFPAGARDFTLLHSVQSGSGYAGGRSVKLTTYLHLMSRSKMVEQELHYFIRPHGLVLTNK